MNKFVKIEQLMIIPEMTWQYSKVRGAGRVENPQESLTAATRRGTCKCCTTAPAPSIDFNICNSTDNTRNKLISIWVLSWWTPGRGSSSRSRSSSSSRQPPRESWCHPPPEAQNSKTPKLYVLFSPAASAGQATHRQCSATLSMRGKHVLRIVKRNSCTTRVVSSGLCVVLFNYKCESWASVSRVNLLYDYCKLE